MGVDTKIYLPQNVQVRDVADVIAILAGKKPYRRDFKASKDGGWSTQVEGVEVKNASTVGLADIVVDGPFPEAVTKVRDGQENIYVLYFFEGGRSGERLLLPRSTPFWKAIGKGLVKFFGGRVDYDDCDDSYCDFHRRAKSDLENNPENDPAWTEMQNRKLRLKPLTEKDFVEFGDLQSRISALNRAPVRK